MSNVVELNSENFEEEVLNAKEVVLVDFAAEWCGPCKRLTPIVHELADEVQGKAKVGHLDIDEAQDIALKYDITSVPTILFFKAGSIQDKSLGLVSKTALLGKLEALF